MRTDYAVRTRIKADDMASPVMKRIAAQARITAKSFRTIQAAARGLRAAGSLARPLERGARTLGFAAIAAGGAALVMANNYATARDEQAKFSRQIGFSADALDRLKFIADRQGASFDTLRSGLTAFTKRVGELRAGTGSLNAILKKTDPAFAQLLKNTTDNQEAFELFLGKVASLPDEQAKAALAAAGVSRGAMESIIRLTDGGVEAFKNLRTEADKFRAPITARDLRNAEAYKDAQTNVNFAIRGVVDTIGSRFLPLMTPVLDRLADWIAANRALIGTKLDEYSGRIATQLARIDFDRIAETAGRWAEKAGAVIKRGGEIVESLGGIEGVIDKVVKAWLILKGLSLAGLVLTVGAQALGIVAAIKTISAASRAARVAANSDFDSIGRRHRRLSKTLGKAIKFGGIIGIGAAGISALNEQVDERAATIEADGVEKNAARKRALDEVTREGNDALLKAIVTATDRLGILQVTDERLRARAGAAPIPVPRSFDDLASSGGLSGRGIGRLEGPRGERGPAPIVQSGAPPRVPRPTIDRPRRPVSDKTEVQVKLKIEADKSIKVQDAETQVTRRGSFANVGETMIEQN